MGSESVVSTRSDKVQRVTAEVDWLLEKYVQLLKAASFVGLTPAEWEEYERLDTRIHQLFGELSKLK